MIQSFKILLICLIIFFFGRKIREYFNENPLLQKFSSFKQLLKRGNVAKNIKNDVLFNFII